MRFAAVFLAFLSIGIAVRGDESSDFTSAPAAGPGVDYRRPAPEKAEGRPVRIVSGFGPRRLAQGYPPEPHEGIDFAVPAGTPVKASRAGKVIFSGLSAQYGKREEKGKGRLIIIRHEDGYTTRYVHLSRILVRPPQEVAAEETIGRVSESKEIDQTVLHFEVRDPSGKAIDPQTVLHE